MKKYIKYTITLISLLLISSCSDDFLDVNTDPNNPVSVEPSLVLPTGLKFTGELLYGTDDGGRRINTLGNFMMYNWSQSNGFSFYDSEFKYQVTTTFYNNIWFTSYAEAMKQYADISNRDASFDNYKAIGLIMNSFHFQILADAYGDVPYTEALKGGINITPAYSKAEDVYDGIIGNINDAINLIKAVDGNDDIPHPEADDIMFQGNMQNWIKFANTLKMRILLRQSGLASKQVFIKEEFNKIIAEGSGFIDADAAIQPGYVQEENKQNPMWNNLGKNTGGEPTNSNRATCASDYVLQLLQDTNDPRVDFIYEKPSTGHLGIPQGLVVYPANTTEAFVSNIGPGVLKAFNQPSVVIYLSETYLMQAEAVLKGYISGNAKEFYESGITASFEFLGSTATDATTYYEQSLNNVGYDSSANKLEAIITQKWIALNGLNGFESWMEFNRTGFPSNLPISMLATTPNRPVRLAYPASEFTTNRANVPKQPNVFTEKVFWGK